MANKLFERTHELAVALREELVNAWSDLDEADRRKHARPGERSIDMNGIIERIATMSKLVLPVTWEEVPVPLLRSGLFQKVNHEMEIPVDEGAINEWLNAHG